MLRLLLYLCLIAPLAYAALWLAENPGHIVLDWSGWRLETSLGVLLAGLTFLLLVIALAVLVIRSVFAIPSRISSRSRLRHYEHGIGSLTRAMSALAIADYRHAEKEINKAKHHLGHDAPAPRLLATQLAHARGDKEGVRAQLGAMLENPDTRLVGLRGMIEQSLREKRIDQAITYAKEAWAAQPTDRWLVLILLDLYCRNKQWQDALIILEKAQRRHALTKQDTQRYRAMIHLLRAQEAVQNSRLEEALELAKLARKEDGTFKPAQQLLIELYSRTNEPGRMLKAIFQSWKASPHPEYVDLILKHYSSDSVTKLQKKITRLAAQNQGHLESEIAIARIAIHHAQWDEARKHLKHALEIYESPRIYEYLAAVERGESGNEKQAGDWLQQAVNAPRDESWVCTRCNHAAITWDIHCGHCQAFDSLVWQAPDTIASPAEAEIVPPSAQIPAP